MKVAFFGGSFNPPHVGHVLAASYALSVGFDSVLAVVVKAHALGKHLEDFEHRARMTELAFEPLPGVQVSRLEASLPEPSYTLNTLHELARRHPDWELRLLAGSDVLREVERWRGYSEIVRLAPLYLLERVGHPSSEGLGVLPEISSSEVRHRLAAPSAENADWLQRAVPRRVLDYVQAHGLYR